MMFIETENRYILTEYLAQEPVIIRSIQTVKFSGKVEEVVKKIVEKEKEESEESSEINPEL